MRKMQKSIHKWAKEKGWWPKNVSVGDKLLLIHSEISEAAEEYRDMKNPKKEGKKIRYDISKNNKPEGLPTELADTVIRILDLAEYLGIDMEWAIHHKMKYNKTRQYKHGRIR